MTGATDFWTDERTAGLKERWDAGYTAAAIALSMGTTRGAVIGKAGRLGLKRSAEYIAEVQRRAAKLGGAVIKARAQVKPPKAPKSKPVNPASKPQSDGAPAKKWQVPFIKAGADQCRYPLWQSPARTGLVCGAPSQGKAFCAYHQKLCWAPGKGGWHDQHR